PRSPRRQFQVPAGRRYCGQCGGPVAARWPRWRAEPPPGLKFCRQCDVSLEPSTAAAPPAAEKAPASPGHSYTPKHLADKILKSRSAMEGERRQVTVLFADLAGFTTLAEKLDPEDVHTIVDACFERITAEIHRFEGTI